MRTVLIALSLTALCAAPARAAEDPMAAFYGNTIVSTGGMAEIHTHYRADHTFDLVGSMMMMSKTFKGTWAVNDKGEICRTYVGEVPPDTVNPSCAPLVARKLGDVWKSKDGSRTITLKAGVQ